jgi:hypothetical protein
MGFQGSIKWWVLRHRLHHRYVSLFSSFLLSSFLPSFLPCFDEDGIRKYEVERGKLTIDSPIHQCTILTLLPTDYGIHTAGGYSENHHIQG